MNSIELMQFLIPNDILLLISTTQLNGLISFLVSNKLSSSEITSGNDRDDKAEASQWHWRLNKRGQNSAKTDSEESFTGHRTNVDEQMAKEKS